MNPRPIVRCRATRMAMAAAVTAVLLAPIAAQELGDAWGTAGAEAE